MFAPALLPLGLRELVTHLGQDQVANLPYASQALWLYQLCQRTLEVNSIPQIVELISDLPEQEILPKQPALPKQDNGVLKISKDGFLATLGDFW